MTTRAPQVEPVDVDLAPNDEPSSWGFEPGDEILPGRSVVRNLGGGSRYEVFLVWDEPLFALGVAKVLRPDQVDDGHALRELRREAAIAARLAHPVIVRMFSEEIDAPRPQILLEHLEGPTLRRLIKREKRLPLEQLVPLALHVAAALQYLATHDTVHLDVKPSNIVMSFPPRLIDLSVARSIEDAARIRVPIGTDAYMAPEQCAPSAYAGKIGPAADVWGLGATLYHAISGSVPYPRSSGAGRSDIPEERFPQLVSTRAPLDSRIPPTLTAILDDMMAPEPRDRPGAVAVAEALHPLVDQVAGTRRRRAR